MIDNISNSQVRPVTGSNAFPHAEPANRRLSKDSDAALQVDFADLIDQAVQTTEAEAQTVQKARGLLKSGRLTSPENIRSAAENILSFGI